MTGLAVGLAGGGLAAGLLVWALSGLVAWVPVLAATCVLWVAALGVLVRDLGVVRIALPERRALVPKSILDQAPPLAAFGFGIQLGLGFRTYVSASAPYLLVIALSLYSQSLPLFLAAGVAFGLGRFAMPAGRYISSDGEEWNRALEARSVLIRKSSAVFAALAAVTLALA